MVRSFDHLTIVVRDPASARAFFAVLGFREAVPCVIKGEVFARYMGVPGIEAEHITLVLENSSPRAEIQMLRYLHPEALPDEHIRQLNRIGMNHICFRVDDIEAEVANIRAAGFSDAQRDYGLPFAQAGFPRRTGGRDGGVVAAVLRPGSPLNTATGPSRRNASVERRLLDPDVV